VEKLDFEATTRLRDGVSDMRDTLFGIA